MAKHNTTHGMSKTTEHSIWRNLKYRCNNKNSPQYAHYGARGISVCKKWNDSFEAFFKDMGLRPNGKELDRIDNEKGYSKENCRWATPSENMRNRSCTKLSPKIVREIRRRKISVIKLAKKYNTTRSSIYGVLYGVTWKDIL